jgi:REP element-mobilizing transposase RayT
MPERFAGARLDAYVVMPDHFHAIISLRGRAARLGDVVGAFKSLTTHAYIRGVHEAGWRPFAARLWQRDYYEHVIRGEADRARIRAYIAQNPARWEAGRMRGAVV